MKGFLIKDFCLAFRNRRTMVLMLVFCTVMSFSMDGAFMISYSIMMAGIVGLGTISYDEYDNCLPFLMSLPIDSRSYVRGKFLFCLLCELFGAAVGMVFFYLSGMIRGTVPEITEALAIAGGTIPILLVMLTIMIPVQLKYGIERSRIAMLLIYGGFAAVAVIAGMKREALSPVINTLNTFLNNHSGAMIAGCYALICAVICLVMYLLSIRVMEKKEF